MTKFRKEVLAEVLYELDGAIEKFPTWPTDPLHALSVLGEEFGELTRAMMQMTYEPRKVSRSQVRIEAVQTAAMAIRLIMHLDRYEYTPSKMHEEN